MARCTQTKNLEVHHKNSKGSNGLDNARVLCEPCHEATNSYGKPGKSPPAFTEKTKEEAKENAKNRCECALTGCH